MTRSLKLVPRAPLSHALTCDGVDVGWIRAGVIGFHGFGDRVAALRAGAIAGAVLREWFAARWHSTPREWPRRVPLPDQIVVDGTIVRRIAHPLTTAQGGARSYGFELALPPETWLALMLEIAQRIHGAIARAESPASSDAAADAVPA